jgi:hypothetical protein
MRRPEPEPDAKMTEIATQLCIAIIIVVAVAFVGWKLFGRWLLGPH